jgi:Flp pilus assembly pilin Flp
LLAAAEDSSMRTIYDALRDTLRDDAAGTLVEYGLLLALIALLSIVALRRLDTRLTSEFAKTSRDMRLRLVPLGLGLGKPLRRRHPAA